MEDVPAPAVAQTLIRMSKPIARTGRSSGSAGSVAMRKGYGYLGRCDQVSLTSANSSRQHAKSRQESPAADRRGPHMKSQNLASLEAKVSAVVQQNRRLNDAIQDEREQRIALMDHVLQSIQPALPAITGRIQTHSERQGTSPERATYDDQRGLRLTGSGPLRDPPDRVNGFEGAYGGFDLFLLEDGSLMEIGYGGSWTTRVGVERSTWESYAVEVTPAEQAAVHLVVERCDGEAIEAIRDALDRQLSGKTERRIGEATERAERIRAILTLLNFSARVKADKASKAAKQA
jgi:hypothetical protein